MRGSRCWTRAVLGGAVALVALGLAEEAVYCQTVPPPKPKPKPKTRTATPSQPAPQPAAARAFLLIDADAPCTVEVNGEGKGQAGGGKTLKVSVELGQNVVKAINLDAGVAWRKVIEVEGAGQKVVTVAVDQMVFHEPIRLGDLVTVSAELTHVGRTSMEAEVSVTAVNLLTGATTHTNTAYFVYVAIDKDGRPSPVPELTLTSDAERARWQAAEVRRQRRLSAG